MIPYNNRFHGHSSINYVYRNGQAIHSRFFTVKIILNSRRKMSRVAVVVSKKVLKSAVRRNRVRRQVYEYISGVLPQLNGVYDIAVIVLSGESFTATHSEISEQLDQIFNQAGIKST